MSVNFTEFARGLLSRRDVRFLLAGSINTLVSYAIFALFLLVLGDKMYQIALALAWGFSSIFSFATQRFFVFKSIGNIFIEYFRCVLVWLVGYLVNAGLLEAFSSLFSPYLAQIIALALVTAMTYFLFSKFSFRVVSSKKNNKGGIEK